MSSKSINLPSLLAFERKLEISDGLMYAGIFDNRELNYAKNDEREEKKLWREITIEPRANRATQSSEGNGDKDKVNANITKVDHASIPSGCDTLKISWTMRIIGNVGKPFSCNNVKFEETIIKKVSDFKAEGLKDLALRYAYNVANGRFLWRNRICAENVEIQVSIKDEVLVFNAYDFSLLNFDKKKEDKNLEKIANVIYQGLVDETGENFASIKINAFVKLDESQQIFPSQEMNIGEKVKTLFQLNGCAAMHNVKIGNAIRTIDTWYGNNAIPKEEGKDKTEPVEIKNKKPIAIEPYGSVTQRGVAYRPTEDDLYTLMVAWVNGKKEISDDNKKYVIANLIRGGVFSKKSSSK